MKTAEAKHTSSAHSSYTNKPFFQKNGESAFFSDRQTEIQTKPFFSKQTAQPFIQTKLSIGQPGDKYEQEADTIADLVVQRLSNPETVQTKPLTLASTVTPVVQPKCAGCEEEEQLQKKEDDEDRLENGIQMKSVFENDEPPPEEEIQRKCAKCEAEEKLQKKKEDKHCLENGIHLKPIFESNEPPPEEEIQRKCAECEAEEKLQKKEVADSSKKASMSTLESRLSSSKGSGSPLPEGTRTRMESSFGADFSSVRIHTGSSAVQMNKDLHAQAFTHGADIYFNSGKYRPESNEGKKLLAHELTHTVQQGGSNSLTASKISRLKKQDDEFISKSEIGTSLFVSDFEICQRVLRSRTFHVTDGNLFIRIAPNVTDPDNPNCQHHNFSVSLTEENDFWFDEEIATIEINSANSVELLWIGLPVGIYYLTFSRLYDNPNCCLIGDIEVTQGTNEEANEKICAYMREKKMFPSQHGGVWDWLGTGHNGTYGPGRPLEGPLEIYETDPGIVSESTCRGACGPNCETCVEHPLYFYTDPDTGITWQYTNLQVCNSHEGCRQHDAAFDWAAAEKDEVGRGAVLKKWHMAANAECACNYPPLNCYGWIHGSPPHDSKMLFAEKAEQISSSDYPDNCQEQNPDFTFCTEEGADMDEVLVLWGMENGYENFRGCRQYWDFPAGVIDACDLAPGRTWHCTATDIDTGDDVVISIFECFCCHDNDASGSDFRRPHVSGGGIREIGDPSREAPIISQEAYWEADSLRRRKQYAQALKTVINDLIASGRIDSTLFNISFVDRTDEGEGLTTTDYHQDPATGDYVPDGPSEVEIYTPAFTSIQFLVSTIMHEYQHVTQAQQVRSPAEMEDPTGEHLEAEETEAYLWEIEHAEETGLVTKPLNIRNTFDRLTDHYEDLGRINQQRQEQYRERYEAAEGFINDVNEPPPPLPGYAHVYHHGSDYDTTEALRTVDITATGKVDFGQGFYTHTKDNWLLTREWALRHSLRNRGWGVVTFPIPDKAWNEEIQEMLYFRHSRSRPQNMPINPETGQQFRNWEDFVRYNKEKGREGDLPSWDEFGVIQGPLWGRLKNRRIHQVMFTSSGVGVLNRPDVKPLRFLRRWLFLRFR